MREYVKQPRQQQRPAGKRTANDIPSEWIPDWTRAKEEAAWDDFIAKLRERQRERSQ